MNAPNPDAIVPLALSCSYHNNGEHCGHTFAEHHAFDVGLDSMLADVNPYPEGLLHEAWETGRSVGLHNNPFLV